MDFNLLFTIPESSLIGVEKAFMDEGLGFCIIGKVTPDPVFQLSTQIGNIPLPGVEWESQFYDINAKIIGAKE